MFVEEDPSSLLEHFTQLLQDISSPNCGIPKPSYIQLMLKYFVSSLFIRIGEIEQGLALAKQLIDSDIRNYFGHMETDIAIEPMMIILNAKFDTLTQMQVSA